MKRFVCLVCSVLWAACALPTSSTPIRFSASTAKLPVTITSSITYFWDGQNVSTCANDGNSCTSATCGAAGIGPCLTYGQIHDVRWNGFPPLVRNATLHLAQLSQSATNDWGALDVVCDQCTVILDANGSNGTSIASGTISNFTALNRAAGTGTLTQMQLPAPSEGLVNATGGYPVGTPSPQLVVDSTTASKFWVYKQSSGAIYFTSTPLVTYAAPAVVGTQYSVAIPANTDSVTIYHPVPTQFYRLSLQMLNWDTPQQGGMWVQGLRFLQGTTPSVLTNASNDLVLSSYVNLLDVASDRTLMKVAQSGHNIDVWQNIFAFNFQSGTNAGYSSYSENVTKIAGSVFFEGNQWRGNRGSMIIDADTIIRDTRLAGAELACAYEDAGANSEVEAGELDLITGAVTGGCTSVTKQGLWTNPSTPFTLNVSGGGRIFMGTTATREFHNVTLSLCGSSTACNGGDGVNVTNACNITINDANLDGAFSSTTFAGNAWLGGCGAISKYGNLP